MRSTNGLAGRRVRRRRRAVLAALAALAAGSLSACGESGKPVLNWYVNPDGVDTFEKYAKQCSTGDYDIEVQLLPNGATDQRTQLARRLAAEDSSTDLMNLDPVFVAEFANAGWLQQVEGDLADTITGSVQGDGDYLKGAAETVTWDDKVYAIPLWANTQVLWYRKSLAQAAGLDMTKPVTWDQVIQAAADNGGTVGVQANKYEAYVVWINALVQGAGGDIVSDTEAGRDAKVDIDSEAGRKAAEVIKELADSKAAQPDLTVSNEGTSLGQMFPADGAGEFMVNWTFVYKNYEGLVGGDITEQQFADLGWARYPATVAGETSKPPIGGIDIGVGAYSDHPDFAMEAARCITSEQAQVDLALDNGLMPSTNAAYDKVVASGDYPADLIELFRTSVDEGGPRPKSAFYAMISGALQAKWHSPTSVDPGSTPKDSATYLEDVLEGKSLL
ncbi:extracellular solute-binding protein [Nocardioides daeguensis]|uniref:ABC transporter substrate-binding protein n=1 Tax=Nocardioides daeguensis TaxID=908359 RepID=A0ABP6W2Y5_9ACTN|nr:extracellular solute-binding protein [Nocardioides daeguensis]MBV6727607.1 extracellular solute-binding protein [Nocardioides daeguensis]MCR1775079.1 extracellular solute-binding protein [Nocardioides daeguensis]